MALPPLHLVAYDIGCPRRWRRVFKLLDRRGARGQLSVFFVRGHAPAMRRLAAELQDLIDAEEDALLIAPVDERGAAGLLSWGRTGAPPAPRAVIL